MTLAVEETRVRGLFERVERIEEVAAAPNLDEQQRTALLEVAQQALAAADPVRVPVAARLLSLSERTIRTWVREGVLTSADSISPRLLLDPERIHHILHLVKDLRANKHDRNLLDAVWYALADQALLDREDLTESIDQMHRGRGQVARSGKTP